LLPAELHGGKNGRDIGMFGHNRPGSFFERARHISAQALTRPDGVGSTSAIIF
jgi:hypothetical protein